MVLKTVLSFICIFYNENSFDNERSLRRIINIERNWVTKWMDLYDSEDQNDRKRMNFIQKIGDHVQ